MIDTDKGSVEVKMRRVFLVMAACCVLATPAFAGGGVDLYGTYGEVVDGDGAAEIAVGSWDGYFYRANRQIICARWRPPTCR